MRKLLVFLALFASLTSFAQSEAERHAEQYWQDFRAALPNPYQTIGFAAFEDNSQLYIISEPPSHVTRAQIEDVFGGLIFRTEQKQWNYGMDGWVKDLLITVKYAPSRYEEEVIPWLSRLLYGYSDKVCFTHLPVNRPRSLFLERSLDAKLNTGSLYTWFVKDDMLLEDERSNEVRFSDAATRSAFGVYRSRTPGFVVWTLPRKGSLRLRENTIRQFALESDMIIGAIATGNTLCILGRERVEDPYDLPPMRTEEICMLAQAPDRLSQSLDIAGLLTGKTRNNYDWCPAYLSMELENTELGHLLTLTDIFLKDWLSGGNYQYNQYRYTKPPRTFVLRDRLEEGITGIRYNWNTNGLLSLSQTGPYTIMAVRNTGCLNASLFDNSKAEETALADKEANAYLASLNNVDLFRSAQYVVLYEIMHQFGITCPSFHSLPTIDKSHLLDDDALRILRRIRTMGEEEKQSAVLKIAGDYFDNETAPLIAPLFEDEMRETRTEWDSQFKESAEKAATAKGLTLEQYSLTPSYLTAKERFEEKWELHKAEVWEKTRDRYIHLTASSFEDRLDKTIDSSRLIPERDLPGFSHYCSYPHDPSFSGEQYRRYRQYDTDLNKWGLWQYGLFLGIDYADIMERYQQALVSDAGPWHKTPKLITTNNLVGSFKRADGSYHAGHRVGGHSVRIQIDAKGLFDEEVQEKDDLISMVRRREYSPDDPALSASLDAASMAAQAASEGRTAEAAYYARVSVSNMSNRIPVGELDSPTDMIIQQKAAAAVEKDEETQKDLKAFHEEQKQAVREINQEIREIKKSALPEEDKAKVLVQLERQRDYASHLNPAEPATQEMTEEPMEDLSAEIAAARRRIAALKETRRNLLAEIERKKRAASSSSAAPAVISEDKAKMLFQESMDNAQARLEAMDGNRFLSKQDARQQMTELIQDAEKQLDILRKALQASTDEDAPAIIRDAEAKVEELRKKCDAFLDEWFF